MIFELKEVDENGIAHIKTSGDPDPTAMSDLKLAGFINGFEGLPSGFNEKSMIIYGKAVINSFNGFFSVINGDLSIKCPINSFQGNEIEVMDNKTFSINISALKTIKSFPKFNSEAILRFVTEDEKSLVSLSRVLYRDICGCESVYRFNKPDPKIMIELLTSLNKIPDSNIIGILESLI